MQTFLPYPNFTESAMCLDRLRLGKQRLEALQILRTLTGESSGWKTHPAVRMWAGHEGCLAEYGFVMCLEWIRRGYKDNLSSKFLLYSCNFDLATMQEPAWLGDEAFHASHRSNLLRKNPEHYSQFGWKEQPDLPYVWPV